MTLSFGRRLAQRVLSSAGYEICRTSSWPAACRDIANVDALVDVGAAYGTPEFYSINRQARLILFEPMAVYEPELRRRTGHRAAAIVPKAIGASSGSIALNYYPDAPTKTTSALRTEGAAVGFPATAVEVELSTLDVELADDPASTFGIKIDTEGHELEVLRGAQETLGRTRFVIIELSLVERFLDGYSFDECYELMRSRGFAMRAILSAKPNRQHVVPHCDALFTRE